MSQGENCHKRVLEGGGDNIIGVPTSGGKVEGSHRRG